MTERDFKKLQGGELLEHPQYGLVEVTHTKGTQTVYFNPLYQWAKVRFALQNPGWPRDCHGHYSHFREASELDKGLHRKAKNHPPLQDGSFTAPELPEIVDLVLITAYRQNLRMYSDVWQGRGSFQDSFVPQGILWYDETLQFCLSDDERIVHRFTPELFMAGLKNTPPNM